MATYLFTWNPKHWDWDGFWNSYNEVTLSGHCDGQWASGSTKRIQPGDDFYLIRLGVKEKNGIIASGKVTSQCFQDEHYADPKRCANYNKIRFDTLLDINTDEALSSEDLKNAMPHVKWAPQASGMSLADADAAILGKLWANHIEDSVSVNLQSHVEPTRYVEGAITLVWQNRYERNPVVRRACLEFFGYTCKVCDFNFEKFYGGLGQKFIHVHHLKPLSAIGENYKVNPKKDLIPVCANCHAMLHASPKLISPKELRKRIVLQGGSKIIE